MKFSDQAVSFSGHETFHLRFAWLSKGFRALERDPATFDDHDQATVTLGVGKNMVTAIRHWLKVTGLVDAKSLRPTLIGQFIFDERNGVDPYLEDQTTLWLLHWLLASNTQKATTVAWFFNKYQKQQFEQRELRAALQDYLKVNVKASRRPSSINTLKNDISVLTRLYAKSQSAVISDEVLDSPLTELGLLLESQKGVYTSSIQDQLSLPAEILGYSIIDLMVWRKKEIMPLDELLHSSDNHVSPGSVFRLKESAFIDKLEILVRDYANIFTFRDTAGLRQIVVDKNADKFDLLKSYYEIYEKESYAA